MFTERIAREISLTHPCSRKNTTEIMRQITEMEHPMYETICKAWRSASDMFCGKLRQE